MAQVELFLDKADCELVRNIAPKRYEACRLANCRYAELGTADPIAREINSYGAEVVVARYLGVEPDITTNVRLGGPDMVWNGFKVDVKRTSNPEGRMMVALGKVLEDADIYILVSGALPKYKIVGWCLASEILNDKHIVGTKYGTCYGMSQYNLHTIGLRL